MKLIERRSEWHKLWSMRFAILAALFGAIDLTLPIWQGLVPQSTFAALSTFSAVAAAVSRVIKQEALNVPDSD